MDNNENKQDTKKILEKLTRRRTAGCSTWNILIWLGIFLIASTMFNNGLGGLFNRRVQISYSEFRSQVEAGNVSQITVQGEQITGELNSNADTQISGETVEYKNFQTFFPSFGDDELFTLLKEQNVDVRTEPASQFSFLSLIINFLPFLILLGIGYYFFRNMQAQGRGMMSIRKNKAKLYDRETERTTFEDVAGVTGAKRELREVIEFLREPEKFEKLGGQMPKGVLLVGPPGTGKTLLARAVAGEAEVPFFSITGSDFMEMFVGVGASRVRDLFQEAKKAAPAIIFIDELDSIGRTRGAGLGGGHDEREQTLNQLLSEMDGFKPNENVIVMAATNRPDILDKALLRPGRFDRRITVDMPTMKDRVEILRIHSRNKPLASEVDLERIARGTPGFSGADLENLLNEAALLAARKGGDSINQEAIEQARDKILMGLKRTNLLLTEQESRFIAYHEAGHAILAAVLPNADPIHKVTIIPRGRAMGVTQQLPEKDKYIYQREYMLDRLAVMMGGRAAERLVFDTATSGAENDLKQATQLARKMVLDWGMSVRFGNLALGGSREQVFLGEELTQRRNYSETTAREVDEEIQNILDEAYQRACDVLEEQRQKLDRLAEMLIEHEEIPGEQVLDLVAEDGSKQKS